MPPKLKPSEPLTQVVFIHDYMQIVFEDESFNIYNLAEIENRGVKIEQGEPIFCNALVSLIGQRVIAVSRTNSHALKLSFSDGANFLVRCDNAAIKSPEAFEFNGNNQPTVVEQNA
jgi:hypothetical protein